MSRPVTQKDLADAFARLSKQVAETELAIEELRALVAEVRSDILRLRKVVEQ